MTAAENLLLKKFCEFVIIFFVRDGKRFLKKPKKVSKIKRKFV